MPGKAAAKERGAFPRVLRGTARPTSDYGLILGALGRPPEIRRVETLSVGEVWGQRFHTTPCHELIHVLSGHADIESRSRRIRVGPGDTFVIAEGTPHRDVRKQGADYKVLYVFFDWPDGAGALRRLEAGNTVGLPGRVRLHLHALAMELQGDYLGDTPGAPPRLRSTLIEMLLALSRAVDRNRRTKTGLDPRRAASARRRAQRMGEVQAYLQAHYAENLGLEELAGRFALSPFNLSRSFSQTFGRSLLETLTTIRMERARELLAEGRSVKEASGLVGYSNGNYFAKVFRRVTGASPSSFLAERRLGRH